MLDYLRVIDQPGNNDALASIINVPSRGIGEATIKALLEEADESKITLWAMVLGTVQGNRASKTKLRKQAEKGLSNLVNIVLTARKKMNNASDRRGSVVDSIKIVLEKTNYEEWLRDHYNDAHKARWDNVQELITQAADFQDSSSSGFEEDFLPVIEGLEQLDAATSLSKFLANVALASHVEKSNGDEPRTAQITISTIHAAKGLEWPVVFIPAAYQGSIPHSRADDTDEERRLLYVAMTRAQALLYMSCPLKNSQGEQATISPFVSVKSLGPHLEPKGPSFASSTIQSLSLVLKRQQPTVQSIAMSSAGLPSHEDDLFKGAGEEKDGDEEGRWDRSDGNPHFTMGQQPAKRRRVDLGGKANGSSVSMCGTGYTTTMDRVAGFSSASTAFKSTFVTDGSYIQTLRRQPPIPSSSTMKSGSRLTSHQNKRSEGQGTLLGFLGKTEHEERRPALSPKDNLPLQHGKFPSSVATSKSSRPSMQSSPITCVADIGISPELSHHRLALPSRHQSGHPSGRRSYLTTENDPQHRSDYCFLSSSSPPPSIVEQGSLERREIAGEVGGEGEIETCAMRPAATSHLTSMSSVLQRASNNRGKNLGMCNTVNKFGGKGPNRAFVPLSIKR